MAPMSGVMKSATKAVTTAVKAAPSTTAHGEVDDVAPQDEIQSRSATAPLLSCLSLPPESPGRNETRDIFITSEVLYQLSYSGVRIRLPPSGVVPGPTDTKACNDAGGGAGWTPNG